MPPNKPDPWASEKGPNGAPDVTNREKGEPEIWRFVYSISLISALIRTS